MLVDPIDTVKSHPRSKALIAIVDSTPLDMVVSAYYHTFPGSLNSYSYIKIAKMLILAGADLFLQDYRFNFQLNLPENILIKQAIEEALQEKNERA